MLIGDVEIYPNKAKTFLMLLLAILMIAGAVSMFFIPIDPPERRPIALAAGALGVPFFGLAAVLIGRKLFDRRPALVLTRDRLINNMGMGQIPEIYWTQVSRVSVDQIYSKKFVALYLKDTEAVLARQTPAVQRLQRANIGMGYAPIMISPQLIDYDVQTLVGMIQERVAAAQPPIAGDSPQNA